MRRRLLDALLLPLDLALDLVERVTAVDLDPADEVEPVECDCDICRLVAALDALDAIRAEEIAALDALYAAPAYGEGGW